jgi:hypothetical protein
MKEAIKGTISRIGAKQTSFLMEETEDKWFSVFSQDQLQGTGVGDKVSFFYASEEKNGRVWNNIKGNVTPLKEQPAGDNLAPSLPRERLILRQNALTNAVNFTINNPNNDTTVLAVLETAAEFEAWTSGDSDKVEPESTSEEPTEGDWQEAAGKLRAAS